MAENIVDALLVTLGLDSSEYQQGMDEAERSTRDFSDKAPREAERGLNQIEQKFGATFQGIFRSFIAPLTAALGTMGMFSDYTRTADRIGKTAARIGASAEDLQAFGEAAKRAGGSVEGFMGAFESLNGQLQRMQAMGGKGRIAPILKQLGIDATENGKVKDTFQILRELAAASDKLGKREFAGLARFLGLDQGTIMLLQQGRVAMDELISRQRALGVYTKEDFEITAKFNDAMSDLSQVFRSLAAVIMRVIVPPMRMIAEGMTAVIKTFREHQGFIVAGLLVIAAAMSGPILTAAKGLLAVLTPLLAPIAAIAGLGLIFDEIATYAKGGQTALEGLWRAIGTPEDFLAVGKAVEDFAVGVWETITDLATSLGGAFVDTVTEWRESFDVDAFVSGIKDAIDGIADALKPLETVWEPIKSAFSALGDAVSEVWSLVSETVKAIAAAFAPESPGESWSLLKSAAEAVASVIVGVADALKGIFEWIGKISKGLREALDTGAFASLKTTIAPLKDAFESVLTVVKSLVGAVTDVVKAVIELFSPTDPGGAWNTLKAIVDAIADAINAVARMCKEIFGWINEKIAAFRSFFAFGDDSGERAKAKVLEGRTEEQYVTEKAQELKKQTPALTDERAQELARATLTAEISKTRGTEQANDALDDILKYADPDSDEYLNAMIARSMGNSRGSAATPAPRATPAPAPAATPAPVANTAPDAAAAVVGSKSADITNLTQTYSTKNEQNVRNETRIETINVNAPAATNAQGIARELPAAIRDNTPNLAAATTGVFK